MEEERLRQMADNARLSGIDAERYVKFGIEWGKLRGKDWSTDPYFEDAWGKRFSKGEEYCFADGDAMMALLLVDGYEEGIRRLTKALDDFNGMNTAHVQEAKDRINACIGE